MVVILKMVSPMIRRSPSQWRDLIEAQESSGLIAAEYCRRHNLNAKYFSLRKKQLGTVDSRFVKITPVADKSSGAASGIKLRVIEVELPLQHGSESDTLCKLCAQSYD